MPLKSNVLILYHNQPDHMKHFKLLFASALLCATQAFAQQSVAFKFKYLPEKKYTSTINMSMDMNMDMTGDEQTMSHIKASGTKLPMVIKLESTMLSEMLSGPLDRSAATFPLSINYKNINIHTTIGDKTIETPTNKLIGQEIEAVCDTAGKLQFKPITDTGATAQLKSTVTKMISNILTQMKFPEKPMHIGDSFTQEIPLNIPIPGVKMDAQIKIIYKLMAVSNGVADFDMEQNVVFNFDTSEKVTMNGTGNGKGTGKVKFDIKNCMMTNMQSNLAFNFNLKMEKINMIIKAQMTQNCETVITKN